MISWNGRDDIPIPRPRGAGWLRLAVRASLMSLVIYGLLLPFWLARLFRMYGLAQSIVQLACRLSLKIMNIPLITRGTPMHHAGAVVANHASWLDIFSLNGAQRIYFVSKSEVRKWPGIGILARSTGTVFIERRQARAKVHKDQLSERLLKGDKLLFFPEGTSTDGRRVLPFRSTMFAAFFHPEMAERMWIQPVTTHYIAPNGEREDFYGWWGDMDFAPHLMMVLAARASGRIEITFHEPLKVIEFKDRKHLARTAEEAVRSALPHV